MELYLPLVSPPGVQWETLPFPIRAHLETITMYRGRFQFPIRAQLETQALTNANHEKPLRAT